MQQWSQGRPIPCRPPRVALELELHMMRESFAAEQRQCQQVAVATAAQIKDLELQLRFERRARKVLCRQKPLVKTQRPNRTDYTSLV